MSAPDRGGLSHLLRPATGEPQGALVLFHGRGVDERDLYPLLDELDPDARLLGASVRGPLTLPPGGFHWYAVRQVGFPDTDTFHSTYRLISDWLEGFLAEHGIGHERLALGGFAQGAVMSYALGLGERRPRPAAIVALSGFLPSVDDFELDLHGVRGLPVAIGHGTHDPVIGVEFGQAARDRLTEAGADVRYRESPMPHSIDPEFVAELRGWLAEAV